MINEKKEVELRRTTWKPTELLQFAENEAVKAAKTLERLQTQLGRHPGKASGSDAVSLARTIAALAAFGRKQPAEQAIEIAAKVEILMGRLADEMDFLFALKK